jgi:hypothetical protein
MLSFGVAGLRLDMMWIYLLEIGIRDSREDESRGSERVRI